MGLKISTFAAAEISTFAAAEIVHLPRKAIKKSGFHMRFYRQGVACLRSNSNGIAAAVPLVKLKLLQLIVALFVAARLALHCQKEIRFLPLSLPVGRRINHLALFRCCSGFMCAACGWTSTWWIPIIICD